ncbi:hypothetical protein BEL04_01930 [Mucilaginibacter sp. PPCGB 2223]|uniref:DUF1573 domain-containing protein n=1 Tax=Mucilaginibacter sp. PPCGB 2223 TaxID=1886027 RepID=UPI00082631C3|nr:DUF1573 domain-containing protein [Mucilaginibacter sp. PPCGB 2223]OCX53100.1 hypothetical protein BEL04_01930 [Mucilaginibacter sp. PPCGB 2223]
MRKVLLGIAAVAMLAACNETYKDQNANAAQGAMATAAAPASNADPATAPIMKFDLDSYSFGKIMQGDSVVHDFKFTNIGKTPLIITDAVATCGCTKPEWPKGPIKPNEGGVIHVTFHSVGKSGLQDKMITITANTVPAQTMVHLVGEVLVPGQTANK